MKKRRKKKKHTIRKYLIMSVIILILVNILDNFVNIKVNDKVLSFISTSISSFIKNDNNFIKTISKKVLANPKVYFDNNFVKDDEPYITYALVENDTYEDYDKLKNITSHITDTDNSKVTDPLIYIYNSHQLETYAGFVDGVNPNVMMSSYYLRDYLAKKEVKTIVEDSNFATYMTKNGLNHNDSYKVSKVFMEKATKTNPSLKYYIDIHRDSVAKSITTKVINNKSYARTLFVVGLENPNYGENLNLALKMHNLLEKYYPGLSRGILKKAGAGVNGVYNQDYSPNTMLIEVGAVENNIDEVKNSTEVIGEMLYKYLKGD